MRLIKRKNITLDDMRESVRDAWDSWKKPQTGSSARDFWESTDDVCELLDTVAATAATHPNDEELQWKTLQMMLDLVYAIGKIENKNNKVDPEYLGKLAQRIRQRAVGIIPKAPRRPWWCDEESYSSEDLYTPTAYERAVWDFYYYSNADAGKIVGQVCFGDLEGILFEDSLRLLNVTGDKYTGHAGMAEIIRSHFRFEDL